MKTPTKIDDALLLAQFSQMYRSAIDSFMDTLGMYRGQSLLLCTVRKQDGMTQSEIAEALSVQGATVTNMLKRLEEAKLVVRRRDPEDNRLVRVYITEEGRALEEAIGERLKHLEESILSGLNPQERETLRQLVWKMIANMGESC